MPQSEDQFRQLADSMPHLAWIADPCGAIYWYNKRWFDYTGTQLEDMRGWGWQSVHHPDHVERVTEKVKHAFTNGLDWEDTFPIRGASGDYRWFLSRAYPIRDLQGKIIRWFGTSTDITDRMSAEEARTASESFARSIMNSSPDCIKVLDLEGRLLAMNEGGQKAMEIDDFSSTCLNRPWVGFWPEQAQNTIAAALAEARTGKTTRFEEICPTAKGNDRWWEVTVTPVMVNSGDTPRSILCVSRDITLRKSIDLALQDALQESRVAHAQAVQANLRKDEFLASMSHELRTPLNAIVGIGHILAKSAPMTDKQSACVKTLQSSSESLLNLINDLLDLSKLESEAVELESIPFNLAGLVHDIAAMSRISADNKKITLACENDADSDGVYIGDPHRLKQIITNLVSNAIKFTERGGVKIDVRAIRKTGRLSMVSIAVSDTGIGIAEDKVELVFSKFSQADSSISRKYGGTGLGLAISKTLSELMGGDIVVQSCQGVGSQFTITLPLAREAADQSSPATRIFAYPFRRKVAVDNQTTPAQSLVLVVEDYEPNLLIACSYLDMLDLSYEIARNGEEGVLKMQSQTYDLVLMDVQMPGMDGLTATQKIREWETANQKTPTPIIGVTAYALMGDRDKCFAAGMNDYLSKPYTPEIFKEKVLRFVGRDQPAQAASA